MTFIINIFKFFSDKGIDSNFINAVTYIIGLTIHYLLYLILVRLD